MARKGGVSPLQNHSPKIEKNVVDFTQMFTTAQPLIKHIYSHATTPPSIRHWFCRGKVRETDKSSLCFVLYGTQDTVETFVSIGFYNYLSSAIRFVNF